MERVISVRVLNQQTSAVLNAVAGGSAITVTNGGQAVARIIPIQELPPVLAQLAADGGAIAPSLRGPLKLPPATTQNDLDIAALLSRDREAESW